MIDMMEPVDETTQALREGDLVYYLMISSRVRDVPD